MKKLPLGLIGLVLLLIVSVSCSVNQPVTRLRIITEEFPPFNYTGKDNKLTGQSTEIVQEIVKRTKSQADFEILPWSEAYALVQKEPNTVLYGTARTSERENLFKWAGPIGFEENNFYVRKDSPIRVNSLEEAKKIGSIAVYKNDSNHLYLAGQGFTNLDVNANDTECLKKLIDGKVDMWLGPAKGLVFIAAAAHLNSSEVKPIMSVRDIDWYIAFNKNISASLVKNWQSQVDAIMKKDSSGRSLYEIIIEKYAAPD